MRRSLQVALLSTSLVAVACGRGPAPDQVKTPNSSGPAPSPLLTADLTGAIDPAMEAVIAERASQSWAEACGKSTVSNPEVVALFRKSCSASDAEGCTELGELYACGAGVERSEATAASLFEKGCALRSADACRKHAWTLLTARNIEAGVRGYQRTCNELDSSAACATLGSLLMLFGKEGTIRRALAFLEKACEKGELGACGNIGSVYLNGKGDHPDGPAHGVEVARNACERGDGFSCGILGAMYMRGVGVAKDERTAAKLFELSCDAGAASGCTYLGACYYEGKGVPEDLEKAAELFRKGCDGADGQACRVLAEMKSAPSRLTPSPAAF